MNQDVLDALYADLPTHVKPGGQGFRYVKTQDVVDRMNKTFLGNWSAQVINMTTIGEEVVCEVLVTVRDEQNNVISQTGFGGAKIFRNAEMGNVYKSAKSKAIKDAVKSWGVGLFLEEETYSGSSSIPAGPPSGNIPAGPPNGPPGGGYQPTGPAPTNPPSTGVPSSMPTDGAGMNMPPANTPPGPPSGSTNQVVNEAPPANNPPQGGGNSMPSFAPPNTTNVAPSSNEGLPQMGNMPSAPTTENVPSNVPADTSAVGAFITPVQEIVFKSAMSDRKQEFPEFVAEMYQTLGKDTSNLPASLDQVPYTDAMEIAAFINKR